MKRIGNVILDVNNIDSISTIDSKILILFKSKNSKSYSEQELGISVYKFLEEIEEVTSSKCDFKDFLFLSLMQNNNKN